MSPPLCLWEGELPFSPLSCSAASAEAAVPAARGGQEVRRELVEVAPVLRRVGRDGGNGFASGWSASKCRQLWASTGWCPVARLRSFPGPSASGRVGEPRQPRKARRVDHGGGADVARLAPATGAAVGLLCGLPARRHSPSRGGPRTCDGARRHRCGRRLPKSRSCA